MRLVYINSKNRRSGTNSNFEVELPVLEITEKFKYVCLLAANIPKSFYTFVGVKFFLHENLDRIEILLPNGNTNRKNLCKYLGDTMTANSLNGVTYTVTYETIFDDGKITFAHSATAVALQLEFMDTPQLGVEAGTFDFTEVYKTPSVINLTKETSIYIRSNLVQDQASNILQEILTSGSEDYALIAYENPNVEYHKKTIRTLSSNLFNFILTDENGAVLETNGINIILTLLFL